MSKAKKGADSLYERRRAKGEWGEKAVAARVKKVPTEIISVRIPTEELDELEAAAKERGETLSEFVRAAIALRVHGEPVGPSVEIRSTGGTIVVQSHILVAKPNENASVVGDFPPELVAM